jgi:hypothetical protein
MFLAADLFAVYFIQRNIFVCVSVSLLLFVAGSVNVEFTVTASPAAAGEPSTVAQLTVALQVRCMRKERVRNAIGAAKCAPGVERKNKIDTDMTVVYVYAEQNQLSWSNSTLYRGVWTAFVNASAPLSVGSIEMLLCTDGTYQLRCPAAASALSSEKSLMSMLLLITHARCVGMVEVTLTGMKICLEVYVFALQPSSCMLQFASEVCCCVGSAAWLSKGADGSPRLHLIGYVCEQSPL